MLTYADVCCLMLGMFLSFMQKSFNYNLSTLGKQMTLVAFNVVNSRNQFVSTIGRALDNIVEPALRRIRRYVPVFGTMDISAVVLFLIILLIQLVIGRLIVNLAS